MKTIRINEQFLQGAVQMELNGLGEDRVKSVEVIIITEYTARIRLNWEHWPLKETNSFSVQSTDTLEDLRGMIGLELSAIDTAIKVFEMRASVSSDPTTEKD